MPETVRHIGTDSSSTWLHRVIYAYLAPQRKMKLNTNSFVQTFKFPENKKKHDTRYKIWNSLYSSTTQIEFSQLAESTLFTHIKLTI